MDPDQSRCDSNGLMFFGKITASISHEIKNVLAIVNENAGLLEDLALMAQRDLPLDPMRVKTMANRISDQVGRADRIIKNMNRFAHSVDQPRMQVMINEIMDLLMALYRRTAAMRNVAVTLNIAEDAGSIMASRFSLFHLLWLCLDHSADTGGSGSSVDINGERTSGSIRLRYRVTGGNADQEPKLSVSEQATQMAVILGGRIVLNSKGDQLDIMLPEGSD